MTDYQYPCNGGGRHRFAYASGWCTTCGRVRDDGMATTRNGVVLRPGPTYTPDELESMRTKSERYLKR